MDIKGASVLLALAITLGCSGQDTAYREPTQSIGEPATAASAPAEAEDPIDWSNPISLQTQPFANCVATPTAPNVAALAPGILTADSDGMVRFYPPPTSSWGSAVTVDCANAGQTFSVDVRDSATYIQEPELTAAPQVKRQRPALKGDLLAPSLDYLLSNGYPPRPDPNINPTGYSDWETQVSRPVNVMWQKGVALLGRNRGGTYQGNINTGSWSGQIINPNGFADWNYSNFEVYFSQFTIMETYCPPGPCAMAQWGGLGGLNNGFLIQNGTWSNGAGWVWGSGSTYFGWWEYIPGPPTVPSPAPSFYFGDTLEVWGFNCLSNGELSFSSPYASFYMYNETSGLEWESIAERAPSGAPRPAPSTIESIVEKPDSFALDWFATTQMVTTGYSVYGSYVDDTVDDWFFINLVDSSNNVLSNAYFPSGSSGPTFDISWGGYN
jgi:hypothetical protein